MCSHCENFNNSSLAEEHRVCETCGITPGQRGRDVRDPLLTGHFPFFSLPFDVRWMIYGEVFKTPCADKAITPDPSYHRRQRGRRFAERTVNNGLALLQSCQQAHEEATAFLYGSNMFYFDDADYGTIQIDASAHCHYCSEQAPIGHDHPVSMTPDIRCLVAHDADDGKHYVKIPRCDFVSMYDWLVTIGERNRLKIKHIHISFADCDFAKVLGEHDGIHDPLRPSAVGGDLIEKALELLAHGHNLDTFGVSFRHRYFSLEKVEYMAETQTWERVTNAEENWTAFERIFFNGLDHRLKNALSSIKGIRELSCDWTSVTPQPSFGRWSTQPSERWSHEGANALEGFKEVKKCMETGYADREMVEAAEQTHSIPYVDQSRHTIPDCKGFAIMSLGDSAFEGIH